MTTYIIRRLLLIIPTIIGVTFLVFMLVALSPGGVGAALQVSAGGQRDGSTSAAQQRAYLEDRYGLDAPEAVQYLRWLARVSPVNFGQRDQITPAGEVISPPREVKEPPAWQVFTDQLPEPDAIEVVTLDNTVTQDDRSRTYRRASQDYARARNAYIGARTSFEELAAVRLRDAGLDKFTEDDGRLKDIPEAVAREHLTGAGNDGLPEAAAEMLETYAAAADARERLQAVFDAKPFDEAGLPIVPGVVHLAPPDLGQSFISRKPVTELIADRLPVTLLLNIIAFPIVYLIAIPSGMLAAARKGSFADVGLGALFVALWSIPIVWAGTLAMGYLANEVTGLGAFPVNGLHARESGDMTFLPTQANGDFQRGYILDTLWHAALPVACLVYAQFAVLSKQTRAAMLENYSADYVRTARAKGVAGSVVLTRHVFRNSLLPLITMFVTIFPAMLGGSVVVERVFSVPGMGSLLLDAIYLRDREVLLANALIIALVNMLALLLADILYAAADPRISYK